MVAANYVPSLARVLVHEGGYANHPKDPGGATMRGVTQRVYDAFRARAKLPARPVRQIGNDELEAIYRDQYAEAVRFDALPIGLDYVQFDGAVHSGPSQATKWLQRALRELGLYAGKIDGIPGNGTLNGVRLVNDVDALIARICDIRKAFLRALKTYSTFGKGWMRRVDQVGDAGQDWADGSVPADRNLTYEPGMERKALVADAALPAAPVSAPTVGAGGGGMAVVIEAARQQIQPFAGASSFIDNVLVGLTVGGAIVALGGVAWGLWAQARRARLARVLDLETPVPA
ncbi:N-acetylmuramidase [Aureimonas flava]|uniref:N-acetylmuramidase n=1 Tax=Aureimonas flava TaxID=2320271 RepID=A0A3A1WPE5_9HYPH|nr:glycosyl hydrolase 108 family protein [Aureimonas flava]RIY03270.1 N-acetylmuramidase [Aureimonas flava]